MATGAVRAAEDGKSSRPASRRRRACAWKWSARRQRKADTFEQVYSLEVRT
jgi:hypothetical protein